MPASYTAPVAEQRSRLWSNLYPSACQCSSPCFILHGISLQLIRLGHDRVTSHCGGIKRDTEDALHPKAPTGKSWRERVRHSCKKNGCKRDSKMSLRWPDLIRTTTLLTGHRSAHTQAGDLEQRKWDSNNPPSLVYPQALSVALWVILLLSILHSAGNWLSRCLPVLKWALYQDKSSLQYTHLLWYYGNNTSKESCKLRSFPHEIFYFSVEF